ncbi:DUF3078 domain-containing protein [Calditrichota bacterium]
MKLTLTILTILLIASLSHAEPWETSVDANLLFSQNAYSNNWTGGETGSATWTFNANLSARKQLSERLRNRNTLKLAFGQTHSQDESTRDWKEPAKSTDLIDFESLLRYKTRAFFNPFAALRFESQFIDLSDTTKWRNINPLKFTESLGLTRVFWDEEKRQLNARLGLGIRQFIDRDRLVTAVPLTRETKTTNDAGLELVSEIATPLLQEKVSYTGKVTLFQALYYSEESSTNDFWKAVDVNWENIFTANITDYLMVNLYMQLLYDKEIALGGRFKQTLSLGLTWKML